MKTKAISLFTVFCIWLTAALSLHAHADLVSAEPAPGARLTSTISALTLTFSEPVQDGTILLFDDAFQAVAASQATLSGADKASLQATFPPLPVGRYTVQWTAVATDNHTLQGSYEFEIVDRGTGETAVFVVIGLILIGSIVFYGFTRRTKLTTNRQQEV